MKGIIAIIFTLVIFGCQSDLLKNKEIIVSKVCDLPVEVVETSGIIFFQGLVWTINDSGNDAILFAIDTVDGELVREIHINGAVNTDWEAISQDEKFIYIADNGNNNNERNNYTIYIIAKDSIQKEKSQTINIFHKIEYSFSDFDLSKNNLNKTNVDSEAILVEGDSVFVYTKDLLNSDMQAFSLPINKHIINCSLKGSYNLGFATTAVTRINDSCLAFLGYKNYVSYLTILKTKPQLTGDIKEIAHFELYDLQGLQTEGITYADGKIFISCENLMIQQALFRINLK